MTETFTCPHCGATYEHDMSGYCCNSWYDRSTPTDPYTDD